jgi:TPR repeat protein
MMYASGLGMAPDQRKARDLFLKSAAQGYSPAMINLGLMLTQDGNAGIRDVLPRPFMRQSNAAAGIQQALLNQSDIGHAIGPSVAEAGQQLFSGTP